MLGLLCDDCLPCDHDDRVAVDALRQRVAPVDEHHEARDGVHLRRESRLAVGRRAPLLDLLAQRLLLLEPAVAGGVVDGSKRRRLTDRVQNVLRALQSLQNTALTVQECIYTPRCRDVLFYAKIATFYNPDSVTPVSPRSRSHSARCRHEVFYAMLIEWSCFVLLFCLPYR